MLKPPPGATSLASIMENGGSNRMHMGDRVERHVVHYGARTSTTMRSSAPQRVRKYFVTASELQPSQPLLHGRSTGSCK
jgi:hypothetical protein